MCKQAVAILGTGSYVPETELTSAELAERLDVSERLLTERIGIRARRVAAPEQATSDLCLEAARRALADAGLAPTDLDLILVATGTPDHCATPSTASLLQHKLGVPAGRCGAADLAAACTGFVYALSFGQALASSGAARHILIVGGETLTRIVDYQDRESCVLFGDGAGAAVLGPKPSGSKKLGVDEVRLFSDGSGGEKLIMPGGGSRRPASAETVTKREHYLRLDGQEIFRFAVKRMVEMIEEVLHRRRWKPTDLGLIIPHQANARMFQAAAMRLNLPENLLYSNLAERGNTSAASIPMALDEALRTGKVPPEKPVLLLGFGGGLTWASAVLA